MRHWSSDALAALGEGDAVALVSIAAVKGSAPRPVGTRMIVTPDGFRGSVGGGNLELQALDQAGRMLALPEGSWRVQDYPLGPLLGQCCGGHVRLLIERLSAADAQWLAGAADRAADGAPFVLRHRFGAAGIGRTFAIGGEAGDLPSCPAPGDLWVERVEGRRLDILLVGAGHVGKAVALTLAPLPLGLAWVDTRADYALDGAAFAEEDAILARIAGLKASDALIVMTHDHGLDYRLVAAGLRGRAGFVGLIGSGTKRARFLSRLAREGVDEATRARLVCPVGLPGIEGKEPAVIGIAIAAQMLILAQGMADDPVALELADLG
ncbi:MAG: xanthine dehydrogenase accessory protein XdhC [Sphingobium sp.]